MNHIDLFSGIGGFSLAARWTWGKDHNVIAFVEQDKYCQKVLNKHWPNVPIVDDVRNYTHDRTKTIDLLTGGFPCQPFSCAGKRRGKEDDRFLWHEMLRIIKESSPTWIIGENVTGIVNMELDNCIIDLESEGYETQTFIIPACAIQAPHRRDRVWIVANTQEKHGFSRQIYMPTITESKKEARRIQWNVQFYNRGNNNIEFRKEDEYIICGKDDGIPGRMDRLSGLGNAIVPQVACEIMRAIKEVQL